MVHKFTYYFDFLLILESETTPDYDLKWEIDDENGVQSSSRQYFKEGSFVVTSEHRLRSLDMRKQMIVQEMVR